MLKLEINFSNIIKIIVVAILVLLLFLMRDIFWLLFVAFIFTSSLNPLVNFFERKRYPRTLVVLTILLIFLCILGVFGLILIPTIIQQFDRISSLLPTVFSQSIYDKTSLGQWISYEQFSQIYQQSLESALNWLRTASFSILQLGIGLIGAFISAITVTVLTFYLLLDHDKIVDFLVDLLPKTNQEYTKNLILKTENKLGTWMRGQILVMLIMATITYFGLISLGIHSALAIALVAGLMELVPFVGPTLTAIPAILVASSQSSYHVIGVIILFFVLQQIEGNLVVAKIMNRAIGLHPIVVILAVTIGAQQGGPVGALLAIPVTTVGYIFFQEWQERRSI